MAHLAFLSLSLLRQPFMFGRHYDSIEEGEERESESDNTNKLDGGNGKNMCSLMG